MTLPSHWLDGACVPLFCGCVFSSGSSTAGHPWAGVHHCGRGPGHEGEHRCEACGASWEVRDGEARPVSPAPFGRRPHGLLA